jgi:hypothetical protein
MSDTPRTDKAQKEYEEENYDAAVYPDFARQLERELTAANAEMARFHRLEAACTKLILRLMTEEQSQIIWMTEEYLSPIRENLKQCFPYSSSSEWNKRARK